MGNSNGMDLLRNHEVGAGMEMIKIKELCEFPEHPFKVEKNAQMLELMQSIKKEGVLVPLLIRKNPVKDGYQVISGHRRMMAAEWAGLSQVPVIIRNLTDEQAVIAMVDSNLHRDKLLPSEKAFAYKMKLEAMKCQGKRSDLTSVEFQPKLDHALAELYSLEAEYDENGKLNIKQGNKTKGMRSNEILAKQVGESVFRIKQFIRLTYLIPKILQMVDEERVALTSAVDISYLTEEEQYELYAVMDLEQSIPNLSQANRMKRMSQNGTLDMDAIYAVLSEIKPNQKEQIKIPMEMINQYFPKDYTPVQQIGLIEQLLKNWSIEQRRTNKNMKVGKKANGTK